MVHGSTIVDSGRRPPLPPSNRSLPPPPPLGSRPPPQLSVSLPTAFFAQLQTTAPSRSHPTWITQELSVPTPFLQLNFSHGEEREDGRQNNCTSTISLHFDNYEHVDRVCCFRLFSTGAQPLSSNPPISVMKVVKDSSIVSNGVRRNALVLSGSKRPS